MCSSYQQSDHQENDILVVIPAKNEERYIHSCLSAVLSQNYPSVDVVVVDNGSSDDTTNIVKKFHNVSLLEKEGGTISSVRNLGARYNSSKYIAFLDGDSVPPDVWLQAGIKILQDDDVSCVGFAVAPPDPTASWVAQTWHMMSSSSKYNSSCWVTWLSSFNLIVKREEFEKINGFNEELETCEDFDLGMRLSKHSRLLFCDQLAVQHLGVVESLKEFFQKELWRGKSNRQQMKTNKEGWRGLIGIIVPFVYLLSVLFLLLSVFFMPQVLWIFLVVVLGLPLSFACRRLKYRKQARFLPKMFVIASLYLLARGVAIVWNK